MATKRNDCKNVLVGVLKSKRDLGILCNEKWYRIPKKSAPCRHFDYLAFYQPKIFGKDGKCIRYLASVKNIKTIKRVKLLADEPDHPRAQDDYLHVSVGEIRKLPHLIKNIIPRRVVFGFTTLDHLFKARDLLQLYSIAATEQIMAEAMKKAKIKAIPQYYVLVNNRKRYRLDFAIFCQNGRIAIECDNKKAHSPSAQNKKDKAKTRQLKKLGWIVIRLEEQDIIFQTSDCVSKIKKTIKQISDPICRPLHL